MINQRSAIRIQYMIEHSICIQNSVSRPTSTLTQRQCQGVEEELEKDLPILHSSEYLDVS